MCTHQLCNSRLQNGIEIHLSDPVVGGNLNIKDGQDLQQNSLQKLAATKQPIRTLVKATWPGRKCHGILPSCRSYEPPSSPPCMCRLESLPERCPVSCGTIWARWDPLAQLPSWQLSASPPAAASQHLPAPPKKDSQLYV